jgi:hypothetical protein
MSEGDHRIARAVSLGARGFSHLSARAQSTFVTAIALQRFPTPRGIIGHGCTLSSRGSDPAANDRVA